MQKVGKNEKENYKNDVDVIVCGATGFVGKQLVPALSVDLNVAVMGRDKKSLSTLFPNNICLDYEDFFSGKAPKHRLFLNLAAANNDHESQSPHYFDEVNYLLPKELLLPANDTIRKLLLT